MHYGSSEEETSEEEARAQDRRGEEDDGEKDGHRSSQDRQEALVFKRRGAPSPRLLYFPSKTIGYTDAHGTRSGPLEKLARRSTTSHAQAPRIAQRIGRSARAVARRPAIATQTIGRHADRRRLQRSGATLTGGGEHAQDAAHGYRRAVRLAPHQARVIRFLTKLLRRRRRLRPGSLLYR